MAELPAELGVSDVLRSLPSEGDITFAVLARLLGSRAHGFALLMLALPDAVPLPVPSASAILGVPMLAISAHLALRGEDSELPAWLGERKVPLTVVRLLRSRLAGLLAFGERLTHQRFQGLAGQDHLIGAACVLLSLLLFLPLPLFNTPPAVCLVLLSWGLLRHDGLVVLIGLAASVAMLALFVFAADAAQDLLGRLFGWSS